jgi:hypothetical protein
MIPGVLGAVISALWAGAGCSSSTSDTGGGGQATTTTTTTDDGTCKNANPDTSACALDTCKCKVADYTCAGLVDNTGKTSFGLRMSELDITEPAVLGSGAISGIIAVSVAPRYADADCHLTTGSGAFSWLLQFDTTAGTLKTGGAQLQHDPTKGYTFVSGQVAGMDVQPAVFDVKPGADGAFSIATGADLKVPIYVDESTVVILPIKAVRFTQSKLSTSQNCIGSLNVSKLDATSGCEAPSGTPTFLPGGSLDGIIPLEEADKVIVDLGKISMCALLTGPDPTYTTSSGGNTVCKRDGAGKILFPGTACTTPGGTCKDGMALAATFSASSVQIN